MTVLGGANLPRRDNRFTRAVGRFLLNAFGWSFEGRLPDVPKQVVIVAPHTSNWDFVIGILAVFALDIRAHWIGKHTLFKPPFNIVMEWLGGIPVNRSVPNDLIRRTAERFSREERMLLGIAPEGTRRRVETWKQGYYRIAGEADVPVTCAGLDYRSRSIRFGPSFRPSGDYEKDFVRARAFFAGVAGRFPEKFHLP